jgi:hypothetical protein
MRMHMRMGGETTRRKETRPACVCSPLIRPHADFSAPRPPNRAPRALRVPLTVPTALALVVQLPRTLLPPIDSQNLDSQPMLALLSYTTLGSARRSFPVRSRIPRGFYSNCTTILLQQQESEQESLNFFFL